MKKVIGLVLLGLLLTGCVAEGEQQVYTGEVQDKYFQKGGVSTGIGLSVDTLQPVVTTNSTSDEYTIFINNTDYSIRKEQWVQLEKGMEIEYTKGFFGITVTKILSVGNEKETGNEETTSANEW